MYVFLKKSKETEKQVLLLGLSPGLLEAAPIHVDFSMHLHRPPLGRARAP